GTGFIAHQFGKPSHATLQAGLAAVAAMRHRGAMGGDAKTGDGAGVLTQIPHRLFAIEFQKRGVRPPTPGLYGVGMFFLPDDLTKQSESIALVESALAGLHLSLLGWRAVPVDSTILGERSRAQQPNIMQCFINRPTGLSASDFERTLYRTRRIIEKKAHASDLRSLYIPSLSSRTIVYKGLLNSDQLPRFYADLNNDAYRTAMVVFHQRYSTNTFPTWERAQPFRFLGHNGEINTLQGNINWFEAREPQMASEIWGISLQDLIPVIDKHGSDSAVMDNVLELMVHTGHDIRQALMILAPEAWENQQHLPPELKAFYAYYAARTEAWDGPAALVFSDGHVTGAALDRNGLRPLRWQVTEDHIVYAGSEAGAYPVDPAHIIRKGRLGPGEIIAVEAAKGKIQLNGEIKRQASRRHPYRAWVARQIIHLSELPEASEEEPETQTNLNRLRRLQAAFGYTAEELSLVIKPMVKDGKEPVGSMGDDTSPAAITPKIRPLFCYFKQRFAQVTNPPIDSLRERLVMSLRMHLGRQANLLAPSGGLDQNLVLESPILRGLQARAIEGRPEEGLRSQRISAIWRIAGGRQGLEEAVEALGESAEQAVDDGASILWISDKGVDSVWGPIPAVIALGAVHQRLVRAGKRARTSLICETGEAREVHHFAVLIGYGANAVFPYLALETVKQIAASKAIGLSPGEAVENYIDAVESGLLKIMAKMGISTLESYCGAQIFECIGLGEALVDRFFSGSPSPVDGIGFRQIAADVETWHRSAFPARQDALPKLPHPGFYKFRRHGEHHTFSPDFVKSVHQGSASRPLNEPAQREAHPGGEAIEKTRQLRDLFSISSGQPISLDEVEPVEVILKRFSTAAMSHGALSREAHETLAMAMNKIGGRSNSGEGGEADERFGTERNSRTKQVASGRFGVTPAYLASADELQIKMAQGSKPGEGGQLPGHKVTAEIAAIRFTGPGVPLISPPPHHDIYSIEDLSQLIYDLRQVNPRAEISVKLVSGAGVGTIAAGVAKGGADIILVSGGAGGTGASPLSSIKNAGTAWEIGLAETHQTLVINGLRERVRLRVDGGLTNGRDVVVAALLGADEYSFGTSVLIAEGCLMARACHLNTCPVGIATQNEELRAKFQGTPEKVIRYLTGVAHEVRELLADLGFSHLDEIRGRTDLLSQREMGQSAAHLDLTKLLGRVQTDLHEKDHGVDSGARLGPLNQRLVEAAYPALQGSTYLNFNFPIRNVDRTVGATLAGEIARKFGNVGLENQAVQVAFDGSAGQSLGAFLVRGMRLLLVGEANDFVGKGMSGGEIIVRPHDSAPFTWADNVIAGNTILYGATGGDLFLAGRAGERFAVRNSGARAVVEGIGDHGCEYMTGGLVVVLGPTGLNFGAGMTGGTAFVLDERRQFHARANQDFVRITPLEKGDTRQLTRLIEQHLSGTSSPRARQILENWDDFQPLFWKVLPKSRIAIASLLQQVRPGLEITLSAV
ncbi:MAG: glutamate synthase large subunit, partial [Anaerolineales bacterium]|nr:glutamate synthase large subunit [Anaerolineales bacterium]